MKKLIISLSIIYLIFLIGCFPPPHIPKERMYKEFTPKIYNDISKRLMEIDGWITYASETDETNIYFKDYFTTVSYKLKSEQRKQLLEVIDKYETWNAMAIKDKITLHKEIGKVPLIIFFTFGDSLYQARGAILSLTNKNPITFSFFSQDSNRHLLAISSFKLESIDNEYITHKPETLYLDYDDVCFLKNALMEETIKEFLKEVSEQEIIEKEFK